MIIDHPVTISTCYSPSWKVGPSIRATCPLQHLVSTSSCVIMWTAAMILQHNANTSLPTTCPHVWTSRVISPTVMLKSWEWTSSCNHQFFLKTSCHILNSIKNPSLYNPCSSPWSSPHLICNMLSMMFGVNVLHEISHIYPNIIHMCISPIWRDHLINPTLNVPYLGPWSNLHHLGNVSSLKYAIETSIHLSHLSMCCPWSYINHLPCQKVYTCFFDRDEDGNWSRYSLWFQD